MKRLIAGSGFTLIELIISIGIVAAMLGLGVPAFRSYGAQVEFESTAQSVADIIADAQTLALAPETEKEATVAAYGVAIERTSGMIAVNRYDAGSPATLLSQVKFYSVSAPISIESAPAAPVLFPIAKQGEPAGALDEPIVLRSSKLRTRPTRTLTINPTSGQVSVQ